MFIGDNTPVPLTPAGYSTGYIPRDYSAEPYGSIPEAPMFPRELLIDRAEWPERIKEKDANQSWLYNIWKDQGIPPLDQNGTNYCWFNGVVTAILGMRAKNGMPYIKLSCASGAAPIKGFRNNGGWGTEALKWIVANGINLDSEWPTNAIDRRYYTEENKAKAAKRKITEWYDIAPGSFEQKVSCAFHGILVPSGYSWWGHEICGGFKIRQIGRDAFTSIEMNSWGLWGNERDGFCELSEGKASGGDMLALRVVDAFID